MDDLANRKKKYVSKERKKKLESLNVCILSLNQKKDLLESTIAELKKNSNEFACKAEHETKSMSAKQFILKSIALKRAVVEEQEELDECLNEKKRLIGKKQD